MANSAVPTSHAHISHAKAAIKGAHPHISPIVTTMISNHRQPMVTPKALPTDSPATDSRPISLARAVISAVRSKADISHGKDRADISSDKADTSAGRIKADISSGKDKAVTGRDRTDISLARDKADIRVLKVKAVTNADKTKADISNAPEVTSHARADTRNVRADISNARDKADISVLKACSPAVERASLRAPSASNMKCRFPILTSRSVSTNS